MSSYPQPPQVQGQLPPRPAPNHQLRLIMHLLCLFVIEPVVLGTIVFLLGITLVLFPVAVMVGFVWVGLAVWHVVAAIMAIAAMSR